MLQNHVPVQQVVKTHALADVAEHVTVVVREHAHGAVDRTVRRVVDDSIMRDGPI